MNSTNFISVTEHKLLLATVLFSLSLVFSSVCTLTIKSYNIHVANVQFQKRLVAERENISDFVICNFGQTYPEVWSRFFSLTFLPLSFLFIRKRKSIYLLFSFILLLLPFFHLWLWFAKTQHLAFFRELSIDNWNNKFLYDSNSFDILILYLMPIILVWHILMIARLFLSRLTNQTNLA